jgi:hypothetical protein
VSDVIRELARKYVWWKTPDEALLQPDRVIAHVMNVGDFDDVRMLASAVPGHTLVDVLRSAEAGQFNARSWAYWHYRLGLADVGQIPPMPERRCG